MLDVFSNIDFTGAKIQGYTYSRDQFQSMIEVKLPSQIILRFLFHPVVIFKYYSRNEFSKFVCVKCNQDHSSLNEFRFLDAQDNVHIMIKAFSFSVSSESDFSLKKNNFLCEKIVLMDNLKINSFHFDDHHNGWFFKFVDKDGKNSTLLIGEVVSFNDFELDEPIVKLLSDDIIIRDDDSNEEKLILSNLKNYKLCTTSGQIAFELIAAYYDYWQD